MCGFVCADSWPGPTRTLTAGCTTDGTAVISLTRESPMGPAGTLCPKVGNERFCGSVLLPGLVSRCTVSSEGFFTRRRTLLGVEPIPLLQPTTRGRPLLTT